MENNSTMRQALERMKYHRYAAIPIIDDDGNYVGTLTEDDLLWKMKNTPGLTFKNTEKIPLSEIERQTQNTPVSVNTQMEELIARATEQHFVPIIDDTGVFIGIVRRSELIRYVNDYLNAPTTSSANPIYYFGFSYENERKTPFMVSIEVSGRKFEKSKHDTLPRQVCSSKFR